MRRTLLISVAALALAAGGQAAFSQGGGGTGGPTMNQSPGGGAGGPTMNQNPSGERGGPAATREAPAAGSAQTEPAPGAQKDHPGKQQQGQAPAQPGKQQQGQAPAPSGGTKQGASETTTKQGASETTTKQGASEAKQGSGSAPGGMASKNVSLTTEQKTTIRQTVLTSSAPRVTNVNFDVKVGIVVPRTVRIAPLPATLISIEPTWRGYMYFVYQDEIIVVEPSTLRIVAVLEV